MKKEVLLTLSLNGAGEAIGFFNSREEAWDAMMKEKNKQQLFMDGSRSNDERCVFTRAQFMNRAKYNDQLYIPVSNETEDDGFFTIIL